MQIHGCLLCVVWTDALNGTAFQSPLWPHSLIDLQIGSTRTPPAIDGVGYFVDSAIILDVIPVPEPGTLSLVVLFTASALAWHFFGRKLSTLRRSILPCATNL